MELTKTQMLEQLIQQNAPMSLPRILREELDEFKGSPQFAVMAEAEQYYRNRSGVQKKTTPLAKRSNAKLEHPILRKLIQQKANYLLAKPFTIQSENDGYTRALNGLFDNRFRAELTRLATRAIVYGIGYAAPYIDENGKLRIMNLPPLQTCPLWEDEAHTRLSSYLYVYPQTVYTASAKTEVERVEFWSRQGVEYFKAQLPGGPLTRDADRPAQRDSHYHAGEHSYNWEQPLFYLKYNDEELPLCYYIRDLIDDINWQASVTADVLRDVAKFIYILKNYGGADLNEFVRDLRESLAIKVESDGGVDKLQADLNIDAVMAFLDRHRKDIYDLAAAVDTQNTDLGNASGVAINYRYMDLDADCSSLGEGLREMFTQMKPLIDDWLALSGAGDFSGDEFEITFNTDLPVNESEIIQNIVASQGIVSQKTLLSNHPWVKDAQAELAAVEEEKRKALEEFGQGLFESAAPPDTPPRGARK